MASCPLEGEEEGVLMLTTALIEALPASGHQDFGACDQIQPRYCTLHCWNGLTVCYPYYPNICLLYYM